MLKKLRTLLLVCAVILLVQTPATLAQSEGGGQPLVLGTEEAYRRDAEAYVAAFGGTLDEAIRHLKLQGAINELDETLQTQEGATFAGLWIEHTPRFRVVVQFTRGGKEVVLPYIQNGPLADMVEVQTALISLKQLRAAHANVIRDLQTTSLPIESDIDLQANKIKVYTTNRKQLEAALSIVGYSLPANVQIVEIAKLSEPIADWYAGLSLSGGICTSGFSLRNAAYVKYSSTAGHCTGYTSPMGPPIFIKWEGAYDFEVHSAPAGYTIKNWAMDNKVPPLYRQITNGWSTAPVGAALCKYGSATAFTCGTVESNNYTYNNQNRGTPTPTWLLIKSSDPNVKIACGGDSGAPVYSGSTAVGEAAAAWCDLANNKFIAMPAGKYTDYGYYVMTAP